MKIITKYILTFTFFLFITYFNVSGEVVPNIKIGYDYDFNIQECLERCKSPLAYLSSGDSTCGEIMKRCCLRHNINQRLLLTRMQFEQNALTAKLYVNKHKVLMWVYADGSMKPCGSVMERICGYGQIKDNPHFSKKYLGFEKQCEGCCHIMRQNFRRWHYLPYILNDYTPSSNGDGVSNFLSILKHYWPKAIINE